MGTYTRDRGRYPSHFISPEVRPRAIYRDPFSVFFYSCPKLDFLEKMDFKEILQR